MQLYKQRSFEKAEAGEILPSNTPRYVGFVGLADMSDKSVVFLR